MFLESVFHEGLSTAFPKGYNLNIKTHSPRQCLPSIYKLPFQASAYASTFLPPAVCFAFRKHRTTSLSPDALSP